MKQISEGFQIFNSMDHRKVLGGMKQQHLQNILVVRTDRIGDVIFTLPVIKVLKSNFPDARVTMLLNSYTADLVEDIADVLTYNRETGTKAVL